MLNHISIKNFAIIENAEVDFEQGLNIVTGETGAGKSIVIEAVSLALGSRADSSCIRTGCEKATVQLTGTLDGKDIAIVREVSSSGKNLCKLNGEVVTLAQLNSALSGLADIHGQYDNQSLLNPDYHIELLDMYKKEVIMPLKNEVSALYRSFSDLKAELLSLMRAERENARQSDFFRFEIDDIDKASLSIGEDDELNDRISILEHSEKIYSELEHAYSILEDSDNSVLSGLGAGLKSIESISVFSKDLETVSSDFADAYYRLKDISDQIRTIKDGIIFSKEELDDAISRLNRIEDLKKKYGNTIEEVLAYREKIALQLDVVENFGSRKAELEKRLLESKHALDRACEKLTDLRKQSSKELSEKIMAELLDLNFKDSSIEIKVDQLEQPQENGHDKVEILISTNKGEPLKPLYKVASGGEMSRIMLAFKNIISSYDKIPTLIFDEIDNGISGITASIVGRKLKSISKNHQIICITHLPQIAAAGDYNYRIYKISDEKSTYTNIEKLDKQGTIKDIARLLGGENITDTTLKSAEELIESMR